MSALNQWMADTGWGIAVVGGAIAGAMAIAIFTLGYWMDRR